MNCPHCQVAIHPAVERFNIGREKVDDLLWVHALETSTCPSCHRFIVIHVEGPGRENGGTVWILDGYEQTRVVVPNRLSTRPPASPEVPQAIARDYNEACAVLGLSANASAALSRRCLQAVLRDAGEVWPGDLVGEIQQAKAKLPTYLADPVDSVRQIGNFAAHPNKSSSTGEILEVEPGEAEFNLEVLFGLLDFYYVAPARMASQVDGVREKVKDKERLPRRGKKP